MPLEYWGTTCELPEPETYLCPECGAECEEVYIKDDEIIGCDCCINKMKVEEKK